MEGLEFMNFIIRSDAMTSQCGRGVCTSEGWKCNGDMEVRICDEACRCLMINFTMKVRKRVQRLINTGHGVRGTSKYDELTKGNPC